MKFLVLIALISIFAAASAKHKFWGVRYPTDDLLYNQNITIKGTFTNPKPTTHLHFQVGDKEKSISFIFIKDLDKFEKGVTSSLVDGGLRQRNVTIFIESLTPNGINVTAEIWGRLHI